MQIRNYEEVVSQLRGYLPDYLESKGIDIEKHFKCISPHHEDKTPSCTVEGSHDGKVFHCFGCGVAGNIFTACHYLEGKPLTGPEFIQENLIYLAEQFKVPVDLAPMTEEQLYELDTYRAYREAAEFITHGKKTKRFQDIIKERKWSSEVCAEFGVGCIESFSDFRNHLKKLGFSASFLDDVDLASRKEIFGEDSLIFTIRDEHGRPVGFASRNLNFNGEKANGSKYCNQKHTGVKCNIYRKSERLFGIDRVLSKRKKKDKTILVFEGYSDVLTAVQQGLHNCVALGGTTFTQEQLTLLKQHGYYEIVLCLDGDEAGATRTAALLDTTLSGHKDLSVRVIIVPEQMDPDEYIKAYGVEKFKRLKKWSAFEWRLAQFDPETEGEAVCQSMVPLIINETSYIEQEKMCKTLAMATGVSLKAIQGDLSRLQNQREAEKGRDRQVIIDSMTTAIRRNPDDVEFAIQQAQSQLYELSRRYNEDSFSEDATLARIDSQKQYEESKDGSFSGFILGPDLEEFQNAMCGEWKKDVWLCFPGKPNCGKTSFMAKLTYEIATHEENDALIIYHSIDDTTEQILPKFVCVSEGSRKLLLNQVTDPNYHLNDIADELERNEFAERRETGYSTVRDLVRRGRLVIKDANDGNSIAYANQVIRYYKDKYPNRNIVYVLDNFHKLQDFQGASKGDERVRFKTMSTVMKDLATRWHICVLCTVEYKKVKQGERGTNADMAETGQIEYDANFVGHIYNEMHELSDSATTTHLQVVNGKTHKLPVIELDIGKNKITAFKNKLFFKFWPESSDFVGTDSAKIIEDRKERLEELRDAYREIATEVVQKGNKIGRAAYVFEEQYGVKPPFEWSNEFQAQEAHA